MVKGCCAVWRELTWADLVPCFARERSKAAVSRTRHPASTSWWIRAGLVVHGYPEAQHEREVQRHHPRGTI
jgi:hypothetical protein